MEAKKEQRIDLQRPGWLQHDFVAKRILHISDRAHSTIHRQ